MSLPTHPLCLPGEAHLWVCTEIRVDGKSYTHMECKKCKAIKDILRTMDFGSGQKWRAKKLAL